MRYWNWLVWLALGGSGGFILSLADPAWQGFQWVFIAGGIIGLETAQTLLGRYLRGLSPPQFLIAGIGFCSGLMGTALFIGILQPFVTHWGLRDRALLHLWLVILFCGGIQLMLRLKWKELSQLKVPGGDYANPRTELKSQLKVLDTSAIIDGRIADLCKTGFLEGVLIVPNFVLGELQRIADSAEQLRRNRGRRGLDLLHQMQKENQVAIKILDHDYEESTEVDTKLLRLARELGAKVVTNDYNLNKVAELYGVCVLNINDLSNAIKPVVIPGEEMLVHVLRDGKEFGQGIGYLEDGTMIVVEGGKSFIGSDIIILVTSVLQTSAGRMIFAKPKEFQYSRAAL